MSVIPAAAPDVTQAASLRVSAARRSPTRSCSSGRSTKQAAACVIAFSAGGGISEPPSAVSVAEALTTGRTPKGLLI